MKHPSRRHVNKVVDLLADKKATHANFFFEVSEALKAYGYTLKAHQRGVGGTHIVVVKNEPDVSSTAVVPKRNGNGYSAHVG